MWGGSPHFLFFVACELRERSAGSVVTQELDRLGYDLVELRAAGSRARPCCRSESIGGMARRSPSDDCAASRAPRSAAGNGNEGWPEYVLEVSSPGIERPLHRAADWRRFVGQRASVLSPALQGREEVEILGVEGRGRGECIVRTAHGIESVSRWPMSRTLGWRSHGKRRESWMVSSAEILSGVPRDDEHEAARPHGAVRGCCRTASWPRSPRSTVRPSRPRSRSTRRRATIKISGSEDRRRRGRGCGREISLEDAKLYDEGFEVGDVMEEPVDFAEFGRAAVQAAKQRIIQRVREGERTRIRDEFATRVGDLLSRRNPADRARQARRHAQQVPRGGSDHSVSRAESPRALPSGRADSRGAQARRGDAQGSAPHSEPRRRAVRQGAVQARGPRDPAGHRRDSRRRRARSAAAPRSRCSRATTRSIRSARASVSRARACRRS